MNKIELATIEDVPELLELQRKAFGPQCVELGYEDAPPMTETLEQAYEDFAKCTTLKVQNDAGRIIGSIRGSVTDGSLYMGRLMVLPEYRQQGIGKQLFREIQQILPHNRAWLCTCKQVPAPYEFYLREGFKSYKEETVGPGLMWVYMEIVKGSIKNRMETNRIILRPWRDSDAETLFKWASDPDVGPRAGWAPHKSVEESLEIIRTVFNDALHTWAIELKETGEAIGAMGYGPSCNCNLPARDGEPLVGYWVAKPYWNQGICTEALRLMLDHIRETTHIKSLISGHFVDNPASGRVMEKCGFVPTGETCIDADQYQGEGKPIRVLRLEL